MWQWKQSTPGADNSSIPVNVERQASSMSAPLDSLHFFVQTPSRVVLCPPADVPPRRCCLATRQASLISALACGRGSYGQTVAAVDQNCASMYTLQWLPDRCLMLGRAVRRYLRTPQQRFTPSLIDAVQPYSAPQAMLLTPESQGMVLSWPPPQRRTSDALTRQVLASMAVHVTRHALAPQHGSQAPVSTAGAMKRAGGASAGAPWPAQRWPLPPLTRQRTGVLRTGGPGGRPAGALPRSGPG